MKKRWKFKNLDEPMESKLLADSLNIADVLAKLLIFRGITTFQQAKEFFRPTLEDLHDPFLMDGMEKATLRVIEAITGNEKILIYGDYDVDGTCSTALIYMYLKELGANIDYYIPNRMKDGYGISEQGIDHAKEIGTSLMISVDCGITAVEPTDYANKLGIDIIICDHHQPKEVLPNAYAVLDPLKPGCNYPFKYLSGAGVALKLARGVSERIGQKEAPLKYLDLVALAGAADIVPLVDENRILVKAGLEQINHSPRAGIRALLKSARVEPGRLNSGQIVFSVAPRINAVGRLSEASLAVELLITDDPKRAEELAAILEHENFERRKIDGGTLTEALEQLDTCFDSTSDMAIVLHGDEWHPGVIGIVASRLVEKYYRPTVMLTTSDGVAKGSARSIANFNIYAALQACDDLLLHFGGHRAAAGLSIEVDKIDEFREKFNKFVAEKISEDDLKPIIEIDATVKFSELTPKFIRIIDQFAPFGPENPKPNFLSEDVFLGGYARVVGNNHLLCTLKQECSDKVFDAIGFNLGEYVATLNASSDPFDIVFTIDEISRDGKVYPQFRIKDIRLKTTNQE